MPSTLRVRTNTVFKQDWRLQSNDPQLQEQDKYLAKPGQQLRVSSIDRNTQKYGGDHWLVTFEQPLQPTQGKAKSNWYVYVPHVEELSQAPSTSITLRARTSTTFKQDWRAQSSNLPQEDKYAARAGEQFRVSSIDRNTQIYGGDHWKVTFEQPLQPNQGKAKSTWFVYVPQVELLGNTATSPTIRATTNTTFKQDWRAQTSNLAEQDKFAVKAGQQFRVSSIDRNAQRYGGDHWKVTFEQPLQPSQGKAKSTWYVYVPQVELLGNTATSATIRATTNTTFKQDWRAQTSNLAEQDKFAVKAGQQFRVSSIDRNAQRYGGDHWKVTFAQPLQPNQGQAKSTWYVYVPHIVYESSALRSDRNIAPSSSNKYIAQVLLQQINGSPSIKAVTNVSLLCPSSLLLFCFVCTSAVRLKNYFKTILFHFPR